MYFPHQKYYPVGPVGACFPQARLAEAWVPYQSMGMILTPPAGLLNGTIFPELVRPYSPYGRKWY